MKIFLSEIVIPGPESIRQNPLPRLRDKQHDREVMTNGSLTEVERLEGLGKDTGTRVLPYLMQDVYDRSRTPIARKVIVMENENLIATFLPWLGGKLYSLTEKATGRPILFTNSVYQPANLAIRDAWTSGGVEWNIGQLGHTFTTCSDVFFAKLKSPDGSEFLRMYEYERQKKLFWSIDFHLPDGAKALAAHVRVVNDEPVDKPMYWWTNTACIETKEARVFSETDEVIFHDLIKDASDPENIKYVPAGFGHAHMPYCTDDQGVKHFDFDTSYPLNLPRSCEYFFQNPADLRSPWEAICYDDGFMFFERSTQPLRYRKMFCWGAGRGGRFWCDFLSEPGKGDYIELQAGLARTQTHGCRIAPNSEIRFTQLFSCARASDPGKLYAEDWIAARKAAKDTVNSVLTEDETLNADAWFTKLSCDAPESFEILHMGSGWGALERCRREKNGQKIPFGFMFPDESLGEEQKPWLELLNTGRMRGISPLPPSYMTDDAWRDMLKNDPGDEAKLLLGVMELENEHEDEARALLESVHAPALMPIVKRMRSAQLNKQGDEAGAIALSREACVEGGDMLDAAFVREYIQLLVHAKRFDEAWRVFASAPAYCREDDRTRLLAGAAAIEVGEYGYLDQLFTELHAAVREGETSLTDLWFRREAARVAMEKGVPVTDALLEEVKRTRIPPKSIDFRMK